ncbi:MAG: Na(+)-translocating NADH-quinone reductase subunit A [Fidelibacterota bacterium]
MTYLRLKKGHDIGISGKPLAEYLESKSISSVALLPNEFLYTKPKLMVKEGQSVRRGEALFYDKKRPEIKWASPGGGKVKHVQFGARRVVEQIVIELDQDEDILDLGSIAEGDLSGMGREAVIQRILALHLWPLIRQRPFNKIADPSVTPKAVFISAWDSAPLAADLEFILKEQGSDFAAGLDILAKLTDGEIHLAIHEDNMSGTFDSLSQVRLHRVNGPHPAGNVGILIHHLAPLKPGEIVWTMNPQHVLLLAKAFSTGQYDPTLTVAVGGPSLNRTGHIKTRMGANIQSLVKPYLRDGVHRLIRGDVLTGSMVPEEGYLGFYDTCVSCIPVSKERPFLGWIRPGSAKKNYSLSRAYLGRNRSDFDFSTLKNGGQRALVPINAWEDVLPMDILPNPLFRAILARDLEEMEKLGILEMVEEDVALCSFACPSKINLGQIVRQGLDLMEKES